jgi:hypothetical protein
VEVTAGAGGLRQEHAANQQGLELASVGAMSWNCGAESLTRLARVAGHGPETAFGET